MKSLLTELENNEVVMLMYLSDELPPADRAEVEEMLSHDASLRRELEGLRTELRSIGNALKGTDDARSAAREAAASRRASQAIRRWSIERTLQPDIKVRRSFRVPTWGYPIAVAAMLTVTFFVWWSKQSDDLGPAVATDTGLRMTEPLAGASVPDGRYATYANAGMDEISRMERQLAAVTELREMVR